MPCYWRHTMTKLIVSEFISLDGVIEAPQNWHFPFVTDDMQSHVMASIMNSDSAMFGRNTYEEFASFWPNASADEMGPMADKLNNQPKYVVSNSLKTADWNNSTIISGDVARAIRDLKAQPGGTIAITGSAKLVQSLLEQGLIDELQLYVHPIIVGKGKRLYSDGMSQSAGLKLIESQKYDGGVMLLRYAPADAS
jgi:dihydrofolate reductase